MLEVFLAPCRDRETIVVGLGKTGVSCVEYLSKKGIPFAVVDSREKPPGIEIMRELYSHIPCHLGGMNENWILEAREIIVSPGVSVQTPLFLQAKKNGASIIGDIELFCRAVGDVPIIAITGSNGKSTVTTLLEQMAICSGLSVCAGGNLGVPVLELLNKKNTEIYVLELSSFQLEVTHSLKAIVTILNISPDHMDRYETIDDYYKAKLRIFNNCTGVVFSQELGFPENVQSVPWRSFSANKPTTNDQYGLTNITGELWLVRGKKLLLSEKDLQVHGKHQYMNALAALALGDLAHLNKQAMLSALKEFPGLPHRCQKIADIKGVCWINDSKATNVGAAVSSISGLGETITGKVVLIAGGDGKNADFLELLAPIKQFVKHVILMGVDGRKIGHLLKDTVSIEYVKDMAAAVLRADYNSKEGDVVLLAPACASFDMFDNFEHRGEVFQRCVSLLENTSA